MNTRNAWNHVKACLDVLGVIVNGLAILLFLYSLL